MSAWDRRGAYLERKLQQGSRQFSLRLLWFGVLATLVYRPYFRLAAGMNAFHDAQFLSAYERNARLTLLQYKELPLWDPYNCGGIYALGSPQTRFASPFFLLSVVFGVDRASVLIVLAAAVIGMEGMYRYLRVRGANSTMAALFAPISAWGGFTLILLRLGWVQFASFLLLPWLLLGIHQFSRGRLAGAAMFAFWAALCIGIGGSYTLPMALVPCAIEWLDGLCARRRDYTPTLKATAAALLLSMLLAAYRWLPLVEELHASTRVMAGRPSHTAEELGRLLLPWLAPRLFLCEFMVGSVVLWTLVGLPRRQAWPAALLAALSMLLAAGQFSPWAPFSLLKRLPVYETLRYPERYLAFLPVAVAVLAALAWSQIHARVAKRRYAAAAVYLLAASGLGASVYEAHKLSSEWAKSVELGPSPPEVVADFRQARGNRWVASEYSAIGRGSITCGEAYQLPMSPRLRGDLPADEYLLPAQAGTVRRMSWSPTRIELEANLSAPGTLVVNQNDHPGWRSSVGERLSHGGLLAVQLPAGEHKLTLRFMPSSFLCGTAASLLGAAFVVWGWRRRKSVESMSSGQWIILAASSTLLLGAAACVTTNRTPAPLELSDQRPVVVASMPNDMLALGTVFSVPLELGGASLHAGDNGMWRMRLAWRRTGKLSPEIGITVTTTGIHESTHSDHPEFSSVLYPSKAPLNQWAIDEFEVPALEADAGQIECTVGLRGTYGDNRVVPVERTNAGSRTGEGVRFMLPAPTSVSVH